MHKSVIYTFFLFRAFIYVTVQFEYHNYYLYVMVWVNVFEIFNKYILHLTFVSIINKNMPDYTVSILKICNSSKSYKQFLYVACKLYRFYSQLPLVITQSAQ